MKLFVLNAGSSSLKYSLFRVHAGEVVSLLEGVVERIGEAEGRALLEADAERYVRKTVIEDHAHALRIIFEQLAALPNPVDFRKFRACVHRVVHGGVHFSAPVKIDAHVIETIRALFVLAPLHNPANLAGIEALMKIAPDMEQIAVFDTAFHRSMPAVASTYAISQTVAEKWHIHRYGFHGISHRYLMQEAAKRLGKRTHACRLITLHLGNGASVAAISGGHSIDTSMGFTPLEGLVMGTRPGDLDAGIVLYLQERVGLSPEAVDSMLNHESGLKGVCGSNDMREIITKMRRGEQAAQLAFALFCYRIRKYIGAYIAVLGGVDALVFSGGIGENSALVRETVCEGMAHLGIVMDKEKNDSGAEEFSMGEGMRLLRIETDEAAQMAYEAIPLLSEAADGCILNSNQKGG